MKLGQIPAGILVFCGGGIGATLRLLCGQIFPDKGFPSTTLAINLVGALLLGFLTGALALWKSENTLRRTLRLGLGTGMMGGFTTYSTLAVDIVKLVQTQPGAALLYLISSVLLGVLCCWIGFKTAEAIFAESAA